MLLSGSPFPAKATYKPTVVVTGVCLSAGDSHTCWLTAAKPYDGASFPTHPDKRYLPQYPHPAKPPPSPLTINIQTPPGSALAAPYVKSCYVLTRSNTCYLILRWIPALQWYLLWSSFSSTQRLTWQRTFDTRLDYVSDWISVEIAFLLFCLQSTAEKLCNVKYTLI